MKPLNETRIQNTYSYIKSYYAAHGVCPTYRNIKDECGYSTLSLVHSDIDRLKERGLLDSGSFKQIKLIGQKEEHGLRYNYPFLVMTDAAYNIDRLDGDERALLEAQDNYLKGEYLLAEDQSKRLLETSKDNNILFGAKLTLCWCAMYTGDVNAWKDFFVLMIKYQSKTVSEKMEKELMAHFLTGALGSQENCPSWLSEGRFYELRKEARPLANLLFVAHTLKETPPVEPRLLEPLCSEASIHHIDIAQVYMDLYLAMSYHYSGNDKYLSEHLNGAIKTCLKHGWLTPLTEMKKPLGSALDSFLEQHEGLLEKTDELYKKLYEGYSKIYEVLVEKNPTNDLSFREVEIINYARLDYGTKEIADKMYLSPETVKHYLGTIYSKLGVSGRKELKELINKNTH